jgi:hypothetical protein
MSVAARNPGSYYISTVRKSGITFTGSGVFATTGTHSVTLYGSGTPTINEDIQVEIQANTETGNADCSALVPITLPAMTYAVIGNGDYSWAAPDRLPAFNGSSFGPNGKVKIVSLTSAWWEPSTSGATTRLNNTSAAKPDIILYFSYGATPDAAISIALANYIHDGGVVIYGSTDGTASMVNILLDELFGIMTAEPQTGGDDKVYPITVLPNDPVINGPFGNLSGRYWGEDNGGSVIVTSLPPNSVQVATASATTINRNPDESIIWYNDSYNFLYFGDSVAADIDTNNDQGGWPSIYNSAGEPVSKFYGPSGYQQYVYDSALELNAVAWAIKKAAINGINPH